MAGSLRPGVGLGAARGVDRERAAPPRSPRPTLSGVSPPDRISGGVPGCSRASSQSKLSPVPPGARSRVGVEQVEVGPECAQRLHLRGVAHARRLDHAAAGAARRLLAVGRPLVAVELEQREAAHVGRLGHLVERRVHEHARPARPAGAAARRSPRPARSGRRAGCRARRSCRAPRRRGPPPGWASSSDVMPQIFTRVMPAYGRRRACALPAARAATPPPPCVRRRLLGRVRALGELDGHGLLVVAAVVRDLGARRRAACAAIAVATSSESLHLLAVDRHDQVAAGGTPWPVSVRPPRRPAFSAGLSGVTSTTSAPWSTARLRSSASCLVTSCICTPR